LIFELRIRSSAAATKPRRLKPAPLKAVLG
jgi:hypothetical protein